MTLTDSQREQIKKAYRRGIVKELYSKSLLTLEQYRRLMTK